MVIFSTDSVSIVRETAGFPVMGSSIPTPMALTPFPICSAVQSVRVVIVVPGSKPVVYSWMGQRPTIRFPLFRK